MSGLKRCYDWASSFYGKGGNFFWKNRFSWLEVIIRNTIQLAKISVPSNSTILDLGCGTGIASQEFLNFYPETEKIIGIDLSSRMGAEAKKNLGERFIFLEGDYTSEHIWRQLPEIVNGVLAFFTLHWLPWDKYIGVVENVYRRLEQNGWFLGISMGQNELGGIFSDIISDLLQIYFLPEKVTEILAPWNPHSVIKIEESLWQIGFSSSRITSMRYYFPVSTYKELTEIVLYQYSFWCSELSSSELFHSAQEKLLQLLKSDKRFHITDNKILVPHHLIVFEVHK